jgi:ABC-type branched-subunit amino acid transport system substrate-binding protein
MVEQDKVFLLIGGGGADQITACARYANSVGVPYLSAGVNEDGLLGIRAYFALSMSYSQQSPLIAQYAKAKLGGTARKVGIAVADSGSFNDAYASIQKAFTQAGFNVVYKNRIPKSANQTQALSIAQAMNSSGAQIVYFLSSPTTFLNVSAAGAGQGYRPQYIGPGLTSGLQTVAQVGCGGGRGADKAIFFSPFPQLDKIDSLDPEYQRTSQRVRKERGDDLGIALWGLNKTIGQMFLAAGKDMSRQSFVSTVESAKPFVSGVFPPVRYSAQNHLGATQVHVLQADCNATPGVFKTVATFASRF